MDKAYLKLYESIWKQAVEDDTKKELQRLRVETLESVFPKIAKYPKEKTNTNASVARIINREYGSEGLIRLETLESEMQKHREKLKKAIKDKIYTEAISWPNNGFKQDKQYEGKYTQIRDNIIRHCLGVCA